MSFLCLVSFLLPFHLYFVLFLYFYLILLPSFVPPLFFFCLGHLVFQQIESNHPLSLACSRLSVSEDDRKSERAKNAISGSEKERAGEPVSIVLKTSFRPLEKRNLFLCQNVKCQNLRIELLARISRGHADLTVCCVLLRSFMSAVSQGISLSVEVSI